MSTPKPKPTPKPQFIPRPAITQETILAARRKLKPVQHSYDREGRTRNAQRLRQHPPIPPAPPLPPTPPRVNLPQPAARLETTSSHTVCPVPSPRLSLLAPPRRPMVTPDIDTLSIGSHVSTASQRERRASQLKMLELKRKEVEAQLKLIELEKEEVELIRDSLSDFDENDAEAGAEGGHHDTYPDNVAATIPSVSRTPKPLYHSTPVTHKQPGHFTPYQEEPYQGAYQGYRGNVRFAHIQEEYEPPAPTKPLPALLYAPALHHPPPQPPPSNVVSSPGAPGEFTHLGVDLVGIQPPTLFPRPRLAQAQHTAPPLHRYENLEFAPPRPPPRTITQRTAQSHIPQPQTGGSTPSFVAQPAPPPIPPRTHTTLGNTTVPIQEMLEQQNKNNRLFLARHSSKNALPLFSGNPMEWPLFLSQYRHTTKEGDFSPEENMTRLEKALRGEARQQVQGLMLVRSNSEQVVKRLEERYGRPQYVIQALITSAKKVPSPKEGKMSSILDFSASIQNLVSTIEAMEVPAHLQNPQLLKELVDKLPDSLRLRWGMFIMDLDAYNLQDFSKWMGKVATAASLVSTPTFTPVKEDKEKRWKKSESNFTTDISSSSQQQTSQQSRSSFATSQPPGDTKKEPQGCAICQDKNHKIYKCPKFKEMNNDQRWEVVKRTRLCFNCLSSTHPKRECKAGTCRIQGCNLKHHSLLHNATPNAAPVLNTTSASSSSSIEQHDPPRDKKIQEISANINVLGSTSVLLRVLPVQLYSPSGTITINALLDDASSVTLLSKSAASQLKLQGKLDPLRLKWTNGTNQFDNSSRNLQCQIGPVGSKERFDISQVRTVTDLSLPTHAVNHSEIFKAYPHLQGFTLKVLAGEAPQMLIGQRHIHLTMPREIKESEEGGPVATRTKLGWVLSGPLSSSPDNESSNFLFSCIHESDDELLHDLVKEQFKLEAIGIQSRKSNRSREDLEAEQQMEMMTKRVGDKWETGLLWRKETGFNPPPTEPSQQQQQSEPTGASSSTREQLGRTATVVGEARTLSAESPHVREAGASSNNTTQCGSRSTGPPPKANKGTSPVFCSFRLPPSREVALRRLRYLNIRFRKNPLLRQQFMEKIGVYLTRGYARRLSPAEAAIPSSREWYLPIFVVTHQFKPGKIRLILDAKSQSNGKSFNDFLYTGPDLLNSLPGIILKFREGQFAYSGDMEDMFHKIGIREEDRPAQRFLIFEFPDDPEPTTYQMEVLIFGCVGSPFQANWVKNRNAEEFRKTHPEAVKAIIKRHYMDDYLQSSHSIQQSIQLINDVSFIHSKGGFRMGKWIANSPEILEAIPLEDRAESTKNLTEWSEVPTERALGLLWNPASDYFTFRLNIERAGEGIADGSQIPTKKAILRLIMLIFDPLGFLSHFLIKARILLQHLWRSKIGWDDEVPSEFYNKWRKWVKYLPTISQVKIPRHYSPFVVKSSQVHLHLFSDASEQAYAAVAYLLFIQEEGVEVAFCFGKARVAPLKPITIPRLELQGAQIATRMSKFIREEQEINISNTFFWTDSLTVLKWIRNEARKFHQFVANRVGEIQEATDIKQWRWVPTKQNPADDATREGHADLSATSRWWKGPEFLKLPQDQWPEEPRCGMGEEEDVEFKKEHVFVMEEEKQFDYLPNIIRFSKFLRLRNTTAYVLQYLDKRRNIHNQINHYFERAESLLFSRSQWEDYPEKMTLLNNNEPIPKRSSLYPLNPILDESGVMRFKTRLAAAEEKGLRLPVILHPKSYLTRLLIRYYHERHQHHSPSHCLNELRQDFWIPGAKSTIRGIIKTCVICRKRSIRLPTPPFMGDLPAFRFQRQPRPFAVTGMDYFGPFYVTVGRRHEKRYGVIFTCLTMRAIHLEIAHSLSTDSCIMAIRRFISRRGNPSDVFSDNGTNLRGTQRELKESLAELNQQRLKDELEIKGIRWHFQVPQHPSSSGVWERMVRSVKTALSFCLKERYPRDEVLRTVFTEVEAIVNSRPLTDVPIDAEAPEALTPFHFLIGSSSPNQPPGIFSEKEIDLGKMWKRSQALIDLFWRRWTKEYVPTLQARQKWRDPIPNLVHGDVVVLLDTSLRRGSWPLGVVVGTYPGNDGVVRAVDIKTATGVYRRPALKCAKLWVRASTMTSNDDGWGISAKLGGRMNTRGMRKAEEAAFHPDSTSRIDVTPDTPMDLVDKADDDLK